jgi:Domain of unknown function (DUF4861)
MMNFGRGTPPPRYVGLMLVALIFLVCSLGDAAPALKKLIVLNVGNPTQLARDEVIAIPLAEVLKRVPTSDAKSIHVETWPTARQELPTQLYSTTPIGPADTLLILVSLGAGQRIQLRLFSSDKASRTKALVYGRPVPEREDDFAWENDKVAYRVYGPALQTTGEISSGIDVWSKRVSDLVINDWYAKDAEGQRTKNPALTYHKDTGQGLDSYDVGLTRGCGGTAIRGGDKFFVSKNYTRVEILASGPIRFQFRLQYAPWQAGDVQVSEEKIITLDAGSHLNRIQSTFSFDGAAPVQAGVGLATHAQAEIAANTEEGILAVWEPLTDPSVGMDGTGIVLPSGIVATTAQADSNAYFVLNARANAPIIYFAGAGWSKSDMSDEAAWRNYLRDFSMSLQHPLQTNWNQ